MFPKKKFPKLIKKSSSLGKISLAPKAKDLELFNIFFGDFYMLANWDGIT